MVQQNQPAAFASTLIDRPLNRRRIQLDPIPAAP